MSPQNGIKITDHLAIESKMTAMERGMQYEQQIKVTLEREGHQAKLWADVPEEWLESAGMIHDYNRHRALRKRAWREGNPLRDTGVDLVVKKGDTFELIQCKNYTGILCQGDLAGFFRHCAYFPHLKGLVYHSNPSLSYTLELPPNYDRIRYIHEPYVPEVVSEGSIVTVPEVVLRDYQREAVTAALRLLTGSVGEDGIGPRTVLNLSCGTGKTICAATVAKSFDRVVVFSPTKVLSEQNLKVFSSVLDRFSVLVDCDGVRDVQVLKGDLAVEEKWLVSATFKSADVVQAILGSSEDLSRILVVVDEFHGLSRAQVTDEMNPMNKILLSSVAVVSMSATPRIFELDNETVDYEELFGPLCYQMKMETAIERGLITDYRVYIPLVHEVGDEDEIMRECGLEVVKKDTTAKCTFLLKGMLMKGARRCIVYLDTHDAIEDFYKVIEKVAREYYGLGDGFWVSALTSEDGQNIRKKTLEKFAEFEGVSIILSVNLLNEGIDILSCDSVFFASPCKSKIRIVQRVCRANRVNQENPGKVASIFVWTEEVDECSNLVGALKEFDSFFCEKVGVISRKYEKKSIEKDKSIEAAQMTVEKFCVGIREYTKMSPMHRAIKILEFVRKHKRFPKKRGQKSEADLGLWLQTYRKTVMARRKGSQYGSYNEYPDVTDYLNTKLPSWLDSASIQVMYYAEQVVNFFKTNAQLPSMKSKDDEERKLGRWLAAYRQSLKGDVKKTGNKIRSTFPEVTAYLDESIPYWQDSHELKHHQKLDALLKWVCEHNGDIPRSSAPLHSAFLLHYRSNTSPHFKSVEEVLNQHLPRWNERQRSHR